MILKTSDGFLDYLYEKLWKGLKERKRDEGTTNDWLPKVKLVWKVFWTDDLTKRSDGYLRLSAWKEKVAKES